MKKLIFLSMVAMLLAFTSCLKDDFTSENSGNEQNVKLSINIPQRNTDSRTAHSNPELTDMRLFLYVMYDGKIVSTVNDGNTKVDLSSGYDKEIRLMAGRQYRIVAWADFGSDYYTVTTTKNDEDKDAISVAMASTTIEGSENMRDAYFYSETFTLTSEQNSVDVKMKRPFGLVKINTLDYNEGTITDEYKPEFYSTEFTNVPTAFDLLTGEANTLGSVNISSTEANIADFETGELSFDYLFANDSQENLKPFTVTYNNVSETEITSYAFENIPFRRNYITNVSGNILTKQGTLNITIEKDWTGEFTESMDVAPGNLQEALNNLGTTEVIEANIVVTGKLPAGTTSYTLPALTEGSTLNITLEGAEGDNSITFGDEYFKGNLNISNEGDAMGIIINVPNGDATIGSGSWSSMEVTTKENTCIIEEDVEIETLTVNGGNVKIYGNVRNIIKGQNATNSKFTWGVNSAERLSAVLEEAENCDTLLLTSDILNITDTDNDNACIRIIKAGLVFDGNGHTVSGNAGQNVMVVAANDVKVKNLTITQPETGAASNGLTAYCVTGIEVTGVTIHNCRKAGMIVNGSEVTATGLHTYGNAWGAVNVSKGTGVSETPVFTFDSTCNLEESNKVWVDCAEPWTVNAPEGWKKYTLNGVTFYIPEDGKIIIPAGTDLSKLTFEANTTYYLAEGEYANGFNISNSGVQIIGDGDASKVNVNGNINIAADNSTIKNITVKSVKEDAIYTTTSDITINVEGVKVHKSGGATCIRVSDAEGVTLNVKNSNLVITKNNMRGINFYDLIEGEKCIANVDNTHIGPKEETMGYGDYNDEQNAVFKGLSDTRGIGVGANVSGLEINLSNNTVVEGIYYAVNVIPAAGPVNVNVENSTLDGRCAFNLWGVNANGTNVFYVKNSKLVGRNPFEGAQEEFATIVFNNGAGSGFTEPKNNHVIVENSEIYCYNDPESSTNTQYAADMRSRDVNTLELKGNTVIYDRSATSRLEYAVEISAYDRLYEGNICNVDETVKFLDKEGQPKNKPIVRQNDN